MGYSHLTFFIPIKTKKAHSLEYNSSLQIFAANKLFFMIKGIIFDLDGTLVNSIEDIADSMNQVLDEKSFPTHDYKAYKTFVGRGVKKLVENSIPANNRDDKTLNDCFEKMMEIYNTNCIVKTSLYPGIAELLSTLNSKGIKLSIFSNKANELTQKVVKSLFADWKFEKVIGSGDKIPRKPNPKGALFLSNEMNINPEKLIFVGDSGVDMETANKAGMYAIGVLWGFRDMEELLENGAQTILNHPMELLNSLS